MRQVKRDTFERIKAKEAGDGRLQNLKKGKQSKRKRPPNVAAWKPFSLV